MTPGKHESRSQNVAHALRASVATLAIGGDALTYAARTQTQSVVTVLLVAFAFGFSLVFVVWSWFMAKHRPMALEGLAALALIVGLALLAFAVALFPRT